MSDEKDTPYYKVLLDALAGTTNSTIPGVGLPAYSSLFTPLPSRNNLGSALAKLPTSVTRKSMALKDQLIEETARIFREQWDTRDGEVVPAPENLQLGNDAVILDATIMYADMRSSTDMVNTLDRTLSAEIYKTYLGCAARIIKANGGTITAYDGDRIMAVFIGGRKNTSAAQTALKINWAREKIINPCLKKQYGEGVYQMGHVVGLDTSKVLVSRIGVRNDNDLVWVGRAANYAAKLCAINEDWNVWITDTVFNRLHDDAKYGGDPRQLMWTARRWTEMNNMQIYGSSWIWQV